MHAERYKCGNGHSVVIGERIAHETWCKTLSPDDIITRLAGAATDADAVFIMESIRSRAMLLAVADLLHIGGEYADSHGNTWLRKAIVEETRA